MRVGTAAGEQTDGRRKRSEASRKQIVRAMLELIGRGNFSPSAEAVAASAGVGLRTVFRHFDNMEALYQEINAAMTAELRPIAEQPYASADWRSQLIEMIERRIRIFERILPFKIAADIHRYHSPFLARQACELTRHQRAGLTKIIPKTMRSDDTLFQSLDLLLSFETWRRLRKEQNLSVARAKRTLERLVATVLEEQ